jgi:hypothetical protein
MRKARCYVPVWDASYELTSREKKTAATIETETKKRRNIVFFFFRKRRQIRAEIFTTL